MALPDKQGVKQIANAEPYQNSCMFNCMLVVVQEQNRIGLSQGFSCGLEDLDIQSPIKGDRRLRPATACSHFHRCPRCLAVDLTHVTHGQCEIVLELDVKPSRMMVTEQISVSITE